MRNRDLFLFRFRLFFRAKTAFHLFLTTIFFLGQVVLGHAQESSIWKERQKSISTFLKKTIVPELPPIAHFGRMQETVSSKNSRSIIYHIQDIHQNEEAQKNIANTIHDLVENKNIELIALEGAFSPINLEPFRQSSPQDTVQKIADYLLHENKISGPINAALKSTRPMPKIVGIDDMVHYNANVSAYQNSKVESEVIEKKLSQWKTELLNEKATQFPPKLNLFDIQAMGYHEGTISLGEFVRVLEKETALSENTKHFLKALDLEKKLNLREIERQRAQLLSQLLSVMNEQEKTIFINLSVAFRSQGIRQAEFYSHLKNFCEKKNVSLFSHSALNDYFSYVIISDSLDVGSILTEVNQAESNVYKKLAQTWKQQELVRESKYFYLSRKLVNFSLTKTEWKEYRSLTPHTNMTYQWGSLIDFDPFKKFYLEAEARDFAMSHNLIKEINRTRSKSSVLVTGGFHSHGIAGQMEKAGFTVINFIPKVTQIDTKNGSSYLTAFSQEKTPLENLFSGEKLFLAKNPTEGVLSGAIAKCAIDGNPELIRSILPEFEGELSLDPQTISDNTNEPNEPNETDVDVTNAHKPGQAKVKVVWGKNDNGVVILKISDETPKKPNLSKAAQSRFTKWLWKKWSGRKAPGPESTFTVFVEGIRLGVWGALFIPYVWNSAIWFNSILIFQIITSLSFLFFEHEWSSYRQIGILSLLISIYPTAILLAGYNNDLAYLFLIIPLILIQWFHDRNDFRKRSDIPKSTKEPVEKTQPKTQPNPYQNLDDSISALQGRDQNAAQAVLAIRVVLESAPSEKRKQAIFLSLSHPETEVRRLVGRKISEIEGISLEEWVAQFKNPTIPDEIDNRLSVPQDATDRENQKQTSRNNARGMILYGLSLISPDQKKVFQSILDHDSNNLTNEYLQQLTGIANQTLQSPLGILETLPVLDGMILSTIWKKRNDPRLAPAIKIFMYVEDAIGIIIKDASPQVKALFQKKEEKGINSEIKSFGISNIDKPQFEGKPGDKKPLTLWTTYIVGHVFFRLIGVGIFFLPVIIYFFINPNYFIQGLFVATPIIYFFGRVLFNPSNEFISRYFAGKWESLAHFSNDFIAHHDPKDDKEWENLKSGQILVWEKARQGFENALYISMALAVFSLGYFIVGFISNQMEYTIIGFKLLAATPIVPIIGFWLGGIRGHDLYNKDAWDNKIDGKPSKRPMTISDNHLGLKNFLSAFIKIGIISTGIYISAGFIQSNSFVSAAMGNFAIVLPIFVAGLFLMPYVFKKISERGNYSITGPPINLFGRYAVPSRVGLIKYNPKTFQYEVNPVLYFLLTKNKVTRLFAHFLLSIFFVPLHEAVHVERITSEKVAYGVQILLVATIVALISSNMAWSAFAVFSLFTIRIRQLWNFTLVRGILTSSIIFGFYLILFPFILKNFSSPIINSLLKTFVRFGYRVQYRFIYSREMRFHFALIDAPERTQVLQLLEATQNQLINSKQLRHIVDQLREIFDLPGDVSIKKIEWKARGLKLLPRDIIMELVIEILRIRKIITDARLADPGEAAEIYAMQSSLGLILNRLGVEMKRPQVIFSKKKMNSNGFYYSFFNAVILPGELRATQLSKTLVHEHFHANSVGFSHVDADEGMTEYLSLKFYLLNRGMPHSPRDIRDFNKRLNTSDTVIDGLEVNDYHKQVDAIIDLIELVGERTLAEAYFHGRTAVLEHYFHGRASVLLEQEIENLPHKTLRRIARKLVVNGPKISSRKSNVDIGRELFDLSHAGDRFILGLNRRVAALKERSINHPDPERLKSMLFDLKLIERIIRINAPSVVKATQVEKSMENLVRTARDSRGIGLNGPINLLEVLGVDVDLSAISNNSYDAIRSRASLLFFLDGTPGMGADRAASETYRILKPGGVYYVLTREGEGLQWDPTGESINQLYTEASLNDLMTRNGFEIISSGIQDSEKTNADTKWVYVYARKPVLDSSRSPIPLKDIPTSVDDPNVGGSVAWISTEDSAKTLINERLMGENTQERLVLGLSSKNKAIIDKLKLDPEIQVLIKNNRLGFVIENKDVTALNFVNKARASVVLRENNSGKVNFLMIEGTVLPSSFFNLQPSDLFELKRQTYVYFVTQTLLAVKMGTSALPNWNEVRQRLISA
ncbi:MAG: hypothetical protein ACKVQC_10300 [Elusimicrobiota bacterium]